MQLSPLQSRLVASLAASLFVLGTYWLLFGPNFALAADLPLRSDPHLDIDLDLELDQPIARADQLPSSSYEPEFGLFDRGIIGRQAVEAQPIGKDTPERWTLNPGESRCYLLSKSEIFGSDSSGRRRGAEHDDTAGIGGQPDESEEERVRRQTRGTTNVYVSATTCLQPNLTNQDAQTRYPGPLRMLVSTSQDVGCPTTTQGMDSNMWDDFEEGLVELTVRADDSPVYVNVVAPKVSKDFEGPYDFEVALSLNSSYHSFDRPTEVRTNLVWMDSDSSAALLLTSDLTDDESDVDRVMAIDPPYELYVEDQNRPVFEGIRRSRCGMEQQAMIVANRNGDGRGHSMVRTSLTTRGTGGMPKQQFYFEGLEETSNYTAVLVQVASLGPNDVFGKRQEAPGRNSRRYMVSEPIEFRTLAGTTCKVITDLEFCTETQWAVPGNPDLDGNELAKVYDDYARKMYSSFEKIMMQIPCETWTTSQYSLTRNCDDCKAAYKRWLCTVAIPRCEDFLSGNPYAIMRNVGQPFPNGSLLDEGERNELMQYRRHNTSRNSWIDEEVRPGPYREIKPCEEVCYEVVQSCPAAIGFQCPLPGMTGFQSSYGQRMENTDMVTCNYPGEPRTRISAAGLVLPPALLLLGAAAVAAAATVL